jgi:hypothetical protein
MAPEKIQQIIVFFMCQVKEYIGMRCEGGKKSGRIYDHSF